MALIIVGIRENIAQLNIVLPELDGSHSAEAEKAVKHRVTTEERRIILDNINIKKND